MPPAGRRLLHTAVAADCLAPARQLAPALAHRLPARMPSSLSTLRKLQQHLQTGSARAPEQSTPRSAPTAATLAPGATDLEMVAELAAFAKEKGLDVAGGKVRRTSSRFCLGVEHGDYNGTELFGVGTDRFIWLACTLHLPAPACLPPPPMAMQLAEQLPRALSSSQTSRTARTRSTSAARTFRRTAW